MSKLTKVKFALAHRDPSIYILRPITFDISREIVVEDIADVRNVDAAGGDVGGDQDVDLTGPEITERLLTVALLPIAVDTLAADAPQGKVRSLQEADDKF